MSNNAEGDPAIYSTFEEMMAAYDKLPPALRLRLQQATRPFSSLQILDAIEGRLPKEEIRNEEALQLLEGFIQ